MSEGVTESIGQASLDWQRNGGGFSCGEPEVVAFIFAVLLFAVFTLNPARCCSAKRPGIVRVGRN